jgi:putative polyhydroxyalkanoate system protein
MATIEQRKLHSLPKDEARKKAAELADNLKVKFNLEWAWRGDTIDFEAKSGVAKGAKGTVDVTDKDIVVKIDLPFMLRAFKGTVESKVKEKLDAI